MKITIHRGGNQIGGNIVEISTDNTRIILDVGLSLDEEDNRVLPAIEGLFDNAAYDAVFISHYHMDHMGLMDRIDSAIPVYIGKESYEVVKAANRYLNKDTPKIQNYLLDKCTVSIGDIKVTPIRCDHSAFDSYMFLIEVNSKKVLYTGDFRSNGRKSYENLLQNLPNKVEALICEGTVLSRDDRIHMTESDLEKKAVGLFQEYEGPVFILQAATNIDRLVSMYKAAKRSRRLFLQDLYMAEITSAIRKSIPDPLNHIDVKVFTDKGYNGNHPRYQMLNQYKGNKIGKAEIVGERFAMCVRSSMLHYLEGLNKILSFDKGLLVYSMWEGYKDQPGMKAFLDACERMGLTVVSLHTSGHADKKAIKGLVDHVHPDKIMPIHTLNPRGFHEFEGIRIQVVTQSELTI